LIPVSFFEYIYALAGCVEKSLMKSNKSLFFILTILLFGGNIYCQKIFRDGYAVKRTGESLSGLVQYSSNQDIPSACTFKRFDIAREVVYSPDEILAFGYKNGNRYESKELNGRNQFYEVIVTGKIVLYRKGTKYYIDKEQNGLVELKEGPLSYSVKGEKTEFNSLPDFLRFLTEEKTGRISDKFNLKNEIIPLIVSYNKESGRNYYIFNRSISEKQLTQKALETGTGKYRFGIVSGVNIYMLNLGGLGNSASVTKAVKDAGFIAGITFEKLLSRRTDRLSLKIDLIYNKHSFYSYDEGIVGIGDFSRNDTFINFSGLKIPVMFQYSVTGKRLVPFINAGVAYQVLIDKSYRRIEEHENSLNEILTTENMNMGFNAGEISGLAGLGVRTRIFNNLNLQLQGRIEAGPGLLYKLSDNLHYVDKNLKQNSLQATFMIGITF
jgi:hypothetical protein